MCDRSRIAGGSRQDRIAIAPRKHIVFKLWALEVVPGAKNVGHRAFERRLGCVLSGENLCDSGSGPLALEPSYTHPARSICKMFGLLFVKAQL